MKTFALNDGNAIPAVGLGTWKSTAGDGLRAVAEALRASYRHIDAAWIYENEDEVGGALGEAFSAGIVKRDEVFVTSKLWQSFHAPDDVERACRLSLDALGLDQLDLYLMHWPFSFRPGVVIPQGPDGFWPLAEMPLAATFEAMLKLRDKGLVKSVGVSNFSVSTLDRLISDTGVVPVVNQVELHPYNPQHELLAYCRDKGIVLTAYSPLGSGDRTGAIKQDDEPPVLENETITRVAAEEGLTPGQVLIAWAVDRGTSVIPKSSNPARIAQNLAAGEHQLSAASRAAIDAIETRFRYIDPTFWFIPGVTYEGDSFWQ